MSVVTGKVIRYDETRGYGFVAPDTGSEDVFLHVNDLEFDKRLLVPGLRVQFLAEEGDRGLKASRVRTIEETAAVEPAASTAVVEDDVMCDIVSTSELTAMLTEALISSVPTITGAQIGAVRECVVGVARGHGWVFD